MQPKIHKKDNPGRPAVSSVNCHTSSIFYICRLPLGAYCKRYTILCSRHQRFSDKIKSCQTHTKSKLTSLSKTLYTNIPNNEGIKAVREACDKHPSKSVSTKVIITFLSLILTLNDFIFNCCHYLQVMGRAMGTICAPAYANIFMPQFEAKHIHPYIQGKALLFLRHIDDIFMIWNGTTKELILFIDELNKKHKTIKFDYKMSTKQIFNDIP